MSQAIQINNDSWVAGISGTIASFVYMAIDGFTVPVLFNIAVVDFVLKAAQTAVFAGIGATSGLIVKEIYPHISKYLKRKFRMIFKRQKTKRNGSRNGYKEGA